MFIQKTAFIRMMKNAWKGVGLRVINKERSYVLTGRTWYLEIFKNFIPKEILGQIIALAGELPGEEEQFLSTKDGNQEELYITPYAAAELYLEALKLQANEMTVNPTDVLIDQGYAIYRLYKDAAGRTYPIPESIHVAIGSSYCDQDETYHGAFYNGGWLYWISTYCAFALSPYEHVMENVEIYPEIRDLFAELADDTEDEDQEEKENS